MTSKRPVHIVAETLSHAGGVKILLELANRLVARDWDVAIWSVNPKVLGDWFKLDARVKYYSFLRSGTVSDYSQLIPVLAKQDGVKLATFWRTALAVADASKPGEGYYLCQDLETSYSSQPLMASIVTQTYQIPLQRITTSRWVEKTIPDTRYIGIGIENHWRPNPKALRQGYVLACARIQALKGWDMLCEVARYVNANDGKMVTFGHNEKLPMLAKTDHHKFPPDDQLRRMYQQAGVFISTSAHEGFSLSQLEAMACGTPTVATNSDGNMEYAEHGVNCFIANDPMEMVRRCSEVITNRSLANKFAEAGVETAARYRWAPVIDRLENILLE